MTTSEAPFEPTPFGKYVLVDKIATGGMAEIFKAKAFGHAGFENLLVIKRILPHIGENAEFVEMFIDEAKVSVALQHPNIVRIFDFGKLLQNYFIAMECVDGKDTRNILRKLSRKKATLSPRFVAYIAHEVAKGLHYAHTKTDLHGRPYGIVHRDVSPSNILVSYEGEVKIVDFGIAKAEINAYETRDGVLKGKFEYMSPEQAAGREVDGRSDLFSLGILLWEMSTGRRLFKADSEIATLKMIRDCDFVPPSKHNPRIPPKLEQITLKALSKLPEERYQSGQEMADELREVLFPATPDSLRPELAAAIQEIFREEVQEERARLQTGSAIARQFRVEDNATTEAPPPVAGGPELTPPAGDPYERTRWFLGAAVILFGALVLGVGVVLTLLFQPEAPPPPTLASATENTSLGALDVQVLPAARIWVNGALKATSDVLRLEDLPPGAYAVKLDADGYAPVEEKVTVTAGVSTRFARTLTPLPTPPPAVASAVEPPPPPPPPPTEERSADGPTVKFTSSPSGATVRVDGRTVGTTPVSWKGGRAGGSYRVEYSRTGYGSAEGKLSGLRSGRTTTFDLALVATGPADVSPTPPAAAPNAPGVLTVTLVGGGWANVYVDGAKIAKTAPLKNWSLPVGSHTVRVENPDLGIDTTQVVEVTPGGTVTVRAAPR